MHKQDSQIPDYSAGEDPGSDSYPEIMHDTKVTTLEVIEGEVVNERIYTLLLQDSKNMQKVVAIDLYLTKDGDFLRCKPVDLEDLVYTHKEVQEVYQAKDPEYLERVKKYPLQ
jgi:hypothetical protein